MRQSLAAGAVAAARRASLSLFSPRFPLAFPLQTAHSLRGLSSAPHKGAFPVITTHQARSFASLLSTVDLAQLSRVELETLESALDAPRAVGRESGSQAESVARMAHRAAQARIQAGKLPDALPLLALAAGNGLPRAGIELAQILLTTSADVDMLPTASETASGVVDPDKAKQVVKEIRTIQRASRKAKGEDSAPIPNKSRQEVAVELLTRACDQGEADAAILLADLSEHFPPEQAQEHLARAAERGSVAATMRLALMLIEDESDLARAVDMLKLAVALSDDAEAHLHLGHMLKNGMGVAHTNPAEARAHLMKASDSGNAEADLYLARWCIEEGREEEARGHLQKAVDRGSAEAKHLLGNALVSGDLGLAIDVNRAKQLYREADFEDALISLGALLVREGNFPGAFAAYQRAATMGSAEAWLRVADMHERGLGVPKDVELAEGIRKTVME